jgi:Fe-S cluster assembly ATP-binding protein
MSQDSMLDIQGLRVAVDGRTILDHLDLAVGAGEVHAIMGPNGSGKSTLTKAIAGHPAYAVTAGTIRHRGTDLAPLAPEERANRGIFIGFQHPVEVPGVDNAGFLRLALNARRKAKGEAPLDEAAFRPLLKARLAAAELDEAFAARALNAGLSGGQKKRNEILQMLVLEPELAILDETDSGLDIDALRIVARGINAYRSPQRAIVLITHFQRLLDLVRPDRVHILGGGRIVESGGKELAERLEREGYQGEPHPARAAGTGPTGPRA